MKIETDTDNAVKGCALSFTMLILALVFLVILLFCSCKTVQTSTTRHEWSIDSTEIVRLKDSIAVLNVTILRQKNEITNENQHTTSAEQTKITEKTTEYTPDGTVSKVNERFVDFSKTTESDKITELKKTFNEQITLKDSVLQRQNDTIKRLRRFVADTELITKTEIKQPSFWQKIKAYLFGALGGVIACALAFTIWKIKK